MLAGDSNPCFCVEPICLKEKDKKKKKKKKKPPNKDYLTIPNQKINQEKAILLKEYSSHMTTQLKLS